MLVLSRRVGESVMVGDDVVLTVLEVRGDVVRVGITAPREVKVHREEVFREVAEANRAAATDVDSSAAALLSHARPAPPVAVPAEHEGPEAPGTDRP